MTELQIVSLYNAVNNFLQAILGTVITGPGIQTEESDIIGQVQ